MAHGRHDVLPRLRPLLQVVILAVVASLAQDGLAHARYVLKRLRARFPDLPLVAACWSPPDDRDEACAALLGAGAARSPPR